jgi:predicted HAD superfamily phosphohydrolase YqeG
VHARHCCCLDWLCKVRNFAKARLVKAHLEALLDIRQLDWKALQNRGVTGVVFDKDNCIVSEAR